MPTVTWTAPVRFVEVDEQGVVFNAHYLIWCDEAMAAFLGSLDAGEHDLLEFARYARVVTTTLTWRSSARWRDVVQVGVSCSRVGRSSFSLAFVIRVGERLCCEVDTVYVCADSGGVPMPVPDEVRNALTAPDD